MRGRLKRMWTAVNIPAKLLALMKTHDFRLILETVPSADEADAIYARYQTWARPTSLRGRPCCASARQQLCQLSNMVEIVEEVVDGKTVITPKVREELRALHKNIMPTTDVIFICEKPIKWSPKRKWPSA